MLFKLWAHLSYFLKDFWGYLILSFLSIIFSLIAFIKVFRSRIGVTKKKIFTSVIFSVLIFILSFAFLEAYFRYRYDVSDGLGFLKVNSRWQERHVVFNNYFFRDKDFNLNKKEGVIRIGVLGDSIALGGGIEEVENRFSNILEKKLKEAGYNIEVYNLGKSGYDTWNEIEEYRKVKQLNFDLIVWEYFINDVQPKNSSGTPIIVKSSKKAKLLEFISDRSYFLDFLYWRFSSRYQKTFKELRTADLAQYSNPEVLENHKRDIIGFLQELKDENKKVVVVIFPSILLLSPNYPARDIHSMMSSYFRENGAEVIDLLPDLEGKDNKSLMASKFDPHPNEIVHRIAAEELYKAITPLLK